MRGDAMSLPAHFDSAMKRGLPEIRVELPHDRTLAIAGGGPSLNDDSPDGSDDIVSVNHVTKWLTDRDVVPKYVAFYEVYSRPEDMGYARDKRFIYWIGSLCAPHIFDFFEGMNIQMWHPHHSEYTTQRLNRERPGSVIIGAGATTAARCLHIGYVLGYRKFKLYGMDSSFEDMTHAYMNHEGEEKRRQSKHKHQRQIKDVLAFRDAHPDAAIEVRGYGALKSAFRKRRD